MLKSWVQRINSPWVVMGLSIAISEVFYVIFSLIIYGKVYPIGIFLSLIIPAVASYPVSAIMLAYHKEIEQKKNELEQLNLVNNKLFSIIAHDIRSPLSSTHGMVDLLVSGKLSLEEGKRHLHDIATTVENLMVFLDDLLLWSKKQIDKEPLQPERFNTEEVLSNTIQLYKGLINGKEIRLKVYEIDSEIFADKGTYSFVVRNILQNAIKYTPQEGTISISITQCSEYVSTTIEDSGTGIAPEKLEKILNRSRYNSLAGTNKETGTGFGLKTVMEYLDSQNGKLEIESVVGSGTKVSIVLPKES